MYNTSQGFARAYVCECAQWRGELSAFSRTYEANKTLDTRSGPALGEGGRGS